MRAYVKGRQGFALKDALVVAVVVLGLLLVVVAIVPAFYCGCPPANRAKCANNLEQVGRAIAAYYGCTSDYYPFTESDYATDSLTLLYPDFTANLMIFACPSTEDAPEIAIEYVTLSEGAEPTRARAWFGDEAVRALKAPKWSSYGYDNRVHHAHAGANHVVAGDMDGTWADDPDSATTNHSDGGNFLRFDGHVSYETTVYCSNNPLDNIFARNADGKTWYAETDSWIRRP